MDGFPFSPAGFPSSPQQSVGGLRDPTVVQTRLPENPAWSSLRSSNVQLLSCSHRAGRTMTSQPRLPLLRKALPFELTTAPQSPREVAQALTPPDTVSAVHPPKKA